MNKDLASIDQTNIIHENEQEEEHDNEYKKLQK